MSYQFQGKKRVAHDRKSDALSAANLPGADIDLNQPGAVGDEGPPVGCVLGERASDVKHIGTTNDVIGD